MTSELHRDNTLFIIHVNWSILISSFPDMDMLITSESRKVAISYKFSGMCYYNTVTANEKLKDSGNYPILKTYLLSEVLFLMDMLHFSK